MSESQLTLLRRHGIRPVKRRGQHFLVDGNLARAIAAEVATIGSRVLELGAGGGALTLPLLDLCQQVFCVEIDRHLCRLLRDEYGGRSGFFLMECDLARLDWPTVLDRAGPLPVVAGNLPYVLTSQVLFSMAENQTRSAGAVLMVQKEVADRLIAMPGSRNYGVLAVVMGSIFEAVLLRTVPATVFWPQPEVASSVVRLLPREPWDADEYRSFVATVKAVFQHRRKQLGTILRLLFALDEPQLSALAKHADCKLDQRPQELTAATWRRLARKMNARGLV